MESAPGEGAVKIVGMTTKDLEYYINWVGKAVAGFEGIGSTFERSSTVVKILSNSYREIVHEKRIDAADFTVVLFWETATATWTATKPHPDQSAAINTEARASTSQQIIIQWGLRWWLAFFFYD